ncbi:MAG: hypothetical protein MUP64_16130 [Anaerolineae bacterium]|nr:hypothetical protein [Anaerolineae bacterium]
MKRLLAVSAALAVVAGVWVSACSVSPTEVPTGDQATPIRTPLAEEEPMTPQPTQGTPAASLPYEARRVVQMAKEDLARKLDLSISEISVISVESVDWSDTSLGCPQPGMMYAQVITPGFLIVLEAMGQTYDYHTDENSSVVLCQKVAGGC